MLNERMISGSIAIALLAGLFLVPTKALAEVYELRTYTTNEGKLDDLHARFRDHTIALFTKHGIESVGYWVPVDEPESKNTLIYIIRHESRDAANASWKAFVSDPQWRAVYKQSEANGPILAKGPESVYMQATDYSPKFESGEDSGDAIFELRIYKTAEGKLDNLNARFRDHTIKIFDQYAMQSVGYWVPTDGEAAKDTLIYILRYPSRDAASASWKSFGNDPAWKKAAKESQVDGKILREKPQSTYMKSTDYSAIR